MTIMYRARIALPVLLGVIVALWGCTPPPNGSADKSLETRVAKLEKELKAAQEQVSSLAAQVRVEQAKVKDAEKDRDEARAALKARGEELAKSQGDLGKAYADLDSVRKGLKDLLGRVDVSLAPAGGKPAGSETTVSIPVVGLK
jgi:peptidoglycan hydrolase CwlO-like protein